MEKEDVKTQHYRASPADLRTPATGVRLTHIKTGMSRSCHKHKFRDFNYNEAFSELEMLVHGCENSCWP